MILRAFAVWFLIALAEVVNGKLRVRLLNRRPGDRQARRVAVFSGSVFLLAIAGLTIPWLGVRSLLVGSPG